MSQDILEAGDHVLIVHRRLFEQDHPRFFVGSVRQFGNGLAKVSGFSWARDPMSGGILMKAGRRTKIISLTAGTLIVYQLPEELRIEDIRFLADGQGRIQLEDGKGYELDLTEGVGHVRR